MPNSKTIWLGVVVFVVIAGGFYIKASRSTVSPVKEIAPTPVETDLKLPIVVIIMDDNGYTPNAVTIKAGQRVEWKNESSGNFWPASNIHPTHTLYPDSSIFKCLTPEEQNIFDACRPIASGKSYTFTFKYAGEWRYHDHLRANNTGTIIVQN